MKIDIGRLKRNPEESESFDFHFAASTDGEEFELLTPIHAAGVFSFTGNEYKLVGRLEAGVRLFCARCLAPVEQALAFDFDESYDERALSGDEADLDLQDVALQFWIATIPMRALCRPDCKGLCPSCGKDINEGECGCPPNGVPTAMESLRELFPPDGEA